MRRSVIATIVGSCVIGLVAVIAVFEVMGSDRLAKASDNEPSARSAVEQPVPVEVMRPVRRTLTRDLRMPATLVADERADLYAKTSGYVTEVLVDIGDRVRKGDVLLRIDVPEMMDELRQAEAVLDARRAKVGALRAKATQAELMVESARAEVQRFAAEQELRQITLQRKEELRRGNAIPEQELDEAKSELAIVEAQTRIAHARVAAAHGERQSADADVKVAEAEVAVAESTVARLKTLMKYATITASFDGAITDRLVDPGAFVRSAAEGTTTPLLKLAKTDRIRLALEIPESDAPWVHVGTNVLVHVKPLGEQPLQASVSRTAGALRPETRTMRAEVDLDNRIGRLAPGMYAQVVVKLEAKEQALMVPSKAIRVRGREVSVLVADGAVAKSVPIKLGYDDGIWAEIETGLSGNEWIITSANSLVAPGAPVKPVSSPSSGA